MQAIIAYTIFEQGTSNVIYRRRGEDGEGGVAVWGLYEYDIITALIFCEQENPYNLNQQRICVPMEAIIACTIFERGISNSIYRRRGGVLYEYNKITLLIFCA